MENLKKGDIVKLVNDRIIRVAADHEFNVVSVRDKYISINSFIEINKMDVKKIGESKMQYEESNRYLLAQAVKEKVKLINSKEVYATAEILGLATGNSKTYFSSQSAKSKFLSRGDLPEKTYQAMLVDLAFAEREVLGIGVKTVEGESYTAVINNKGDVVDIIKTGTVEEPSDAEIQMVDFADAVDISVKHDDQAEAASYALQKLIENQERKKIKPTSNKPLFIGAAAVIFIALILFILNISQVV